jgi:hypothetical protein
MPHWHVRNVKVDRTRKMGLKPVSRYTKGTREKNAGILTKNIPVSNNID